MEYSYFHRCSMATTFSRLPSSCLPWFIKLHRTESNDQWILAYQKLWSFQSISSFFFTLFILHTQALLYYSPNTVVLSLFCLDCFIFFRAHLGFFEAGHPHSVFPFFFSIHIYYCFRPGSYFFTSWCSFSFYYRVLLYVVPCFSFIHNNNKIHITRYINCFIAHLEGGRERGG